MANKAKFKIDFDGAYFSGYQWVPGVLFGGRWGYVSSTLSRDLSETLERLKAMAKNTDRFYDADMNEITQ